MNNLPEKLTRSRAQQPKMNSDQFGGQWGSCCLAGSDKEEDTMKKGTGKVSA